MVFIFGLFHKPMKITMKSKCLMELNTIIGPTDQYVKMIGNVRWLTYITELGQKQLGELRNELLQIVTETNYRTKYYFYQVIV